MYWTLVGDPCTTADRDKFYNHTKFTKMKSFKRILIYICSYMSIHVQNMSTLL